mmetsp:Transcript_15252/g.42222  ORF Transcript_15252/g.42222 Transcript_15252/m.42222 type:complete len:751 (-) Transcript_15252:650-2902(-)
MATVNRSRRYLPDARRKVQKSNRLYGSGPTVNGNTASTTGQQNPQAMSQLDDSADSCESVVVRDKSGEPKTRVSILAKAPPRSPRPERRIDSPSQLSPRCFAALSNALQTDNKYATPRYSPLPQLEDRQEKTVAGYSIDERQSPSTMEYSQLRKQFRRPSATLTIPELSVHSPRTPNSIQSEFPSNASEMNNEPSPTPSRATQPTAKTSSLLRHPQLRFDTPERPQPRVLIFQDEKSPKPSPRLSQPPPKIYPPDLSKAALPQSRGLKPSPYNISANTVPLNPNPPTTPQQLSSRDELTNQELSTWRRTPANAQSQEEEFHHRAGSDTSTRESAESLTPSELQDHLFSNSSRGRSLTPNNLQDQLLSNTRRGRSLTPNELQDRLLYSTNRTNGRAASGKRTTQQLEEDDANPNALVVQSLSRMSKSAALPELQVIRVRSLAPSSGSASEFRGMPDSFYGRPDKDAHSLQDESDAAVQVTEESASTRMEGDKAIPLAVAVTTKSKKPQQPTKQNESAFLPEAIEHRRNDTQGPSNLRDWTTQQPRDKKAKKDRHKAYMMAKLGTYRLKQGNVREARVALSDSLSMRQKVSPEASVADLLNNIGNCANLEAVDEYNLSIDFYHQALADLQSHNGTQSDLSHTWYNIGRAHVQRNDWKSAKLALEEALQLSLGIHGKHHVYVAQCLDLKGFVNFSTSKYDDALECFDQALRAYLKNYGPNSIHVANGLYNIAMVQEAAGDFVTKTIDCSPQVH